MTAHWNRFQGNSLALAAAAMLGLLAATAHADPVGATLAATYYEVLSGTGAPDFGGQGTPNVATGSALGPHGLPMAVAGAEDISSFDPTTEEITWWSPSLNSAVKQTGTGTITLPYSSNMYAPNSSGSNDASAFETATFKGSFSLAAASVVSFALGSDDDSFIYVDGILIGQNQGIHGLSSVAFDSPLLSVGTHSIDVFYADREQVGAALSLSLLTQGVVITPPPTNVPGVPEPETWGMLLAGLGVVGWRGRRRKLG